MADILKSIGSIIQGKGLQYISKKTKQLRHKVGEKSEAWFNPIPEAVAGEVLRVGDVVSYALFNQRKSLYSDGDIPNEVVVKTDSSEGNNEKAIGFVLEPAAKNQKVHIVSSGDFRINIDDTVDEFYRNLKKEDIGKSIYVADNGGGRGKVTLDKGNATLKMNNVIQLGVIADVVTTNYDPPTVLNALIHVQSDGDDRGVTDFTESRYVLGEKINTSFAPHKNNKVFAVCVGQGTSGDKVKISFKKENVVKDRTNEDSLFNEFTYIYIEEKLGWGRYLYIVKGTKGKEINFYDKSFLASKGITDFSIFASLLENETDYSIPNTNIKLNFIDFNDGVESKTIYKRIIQDIIIAKHLREINLQNEDGNPIADDLSAIDDNNIFKIESSYFPLYPVPIKFSFKLGNEISYKQENEGSLPMSKNKVYLADPRYDKRQPVIGFIKDIKNNTSYNEDAEVIVVHEGLVKTCNPITEGRKYYLGKRGDIVENPEKDFINTIVVGVGHTQKNLKINIGQATNYYSEGRALGDLAFFEDDLELAYYGYIKSGTLITEEMANTSAFEDLYKYFIAMGKTLQNVTPTANGYHSYKVPEIEMGGKRAYIRYIASTDNYNFPKRTYMEVETHKIIKDSSTGGYKLDNPIDITGLIYTNPDFVVTEPWILNRKDIRIKAFIQIAESYIELHEGFIQDGDITYGFNWKILKNTDGTNSLWKLHMDLNGSRGVYLKNLFLVPGTPAEEFKLLIRLERDEIWTRDMKINYNISGDAASLPITNTLIDVDNKAPSSKAVKNHIDTQLGVIKTELENNVITQFTGLNGALTGRVSTLETTVTGHTAQINEFDNKIKTLTSKMMSIYLHCPQFKLYPASGSPSVKISKGVLQSPIETLSGGSNFEFSTNKESYPLTGVSRFLFKNDNTPKLTFEGTATNKVKLNGIYFERADEDKRIKVDTIEFKHIHFKKQFILKGLDNATTILFENCIFDKSISITMDSTKDLEKTNFLNMQRITLRTCQITNVNTFLPEFEYKITGNIIHNGIAKATLKNEGSSTLNGSFSTDTGRYLIYRP